MLRPYVCVNMAASADGKITSARREVPHFTSDRDRKTMDRLRAEADAILVGAGTLRADDPVLGVRDAEMQDYRRTLGKPRELTGLVVTRSGRVDPGWRFFRDPGLGERVVATTEQARDPALEGLEGRAEVWRVGRERLDLPGLLGRLRQRGVERLLVEGGGEMNWAFVREDLLDELYLTIAPCLFGGRDAPTLLEGEGLSMDERRRLRLADLVREGDELYCRYTVVR